MKSSEIALLFFVLWSTFLECVIIYQYFKRKEIEKELCDIDLENSRLRMENRKFTNNK